MCDATDGAVVSLEALDTVALGKVAVRGAGELEKDFCCVEDRVAVSFVVQVLVGSVVDASCGLEDLLVLTVIAELGIGLDRLAV
jgi:hypothetical protein